MAHGAGHAALEDEYHFAVLGISGVGKHSFLHAFNDIDESMGASDDDSDELDHVTLEIATLLGPTRIQLYACNRGGELTPDDRSDWETLKTTPIAGALLFFDVSSRMSYKVLPECYRDICESFPDIPIAVVANKVRCRKCTCQSTFRTLLDTYSAGGTNGQKGQAKDDHVSPQEK
jgi:hypothetical protein